MGAGKVIVVYDDSHDHSLDGKLTAPVVIMCIAVASAGFLSGYNLGVFGGVTTMPSFLREFFPSVMHKMSSQKQDQSCIFDSPRLTSFTCSLYIAAMFSALMGGSLTTSAGRKGSLIIGGMIYLIGVSIKTLAVNLEMLILGRVLAGFGLGFIDQAAPIYLSEMAPARWRGAIGTSFPFFCSFGVIAANVVSFYLAPLGDNNWRIAIGLSGLPAIILTVVAFLIPDTPSSLIQRGKVEEALESLNQVRSVETDTENELKYLLKYHEAVKNASEKSYQILLERRYRPHLVMAIAIPSFAQLTGINLLGGLGNLIFGSLRLSIGRTFLVSTLLGLFIFLSVFVATFVIDRFGRRILLLQAGLQIFISQLVFAFLMANKADSAQYFSESTGYVAVFLTGFIGSANTWSWASLLWILPSEILPTEVRSAGQGLCISVNFLFQIITTQTTNPMLCNFKFGVFLYYAAWVLIMTIFVFFFLPETKKIPLELTDRIWRGHWYWHRFVDQETM